MFFISYSPKKTNILEKIRGITLFNGHIYIIQNHTLKNVRDRNIAYASTILHELCHLFRLQQVGYKIEKYTPQRWVCEAGRNIQIELFKVYYPNMQNNTDIIKAIFPSVAEADIENTLNGHNKDGEINFINAVKKFFDDCESRKLQIIDLTKD